MIYLCSLSYPFLYYVMSSVTSVLQIQKFSCLKELQTVYDKLNVLKG